MIEHPQLIFAAIILSVAALIAWLFWMLPEWSRPELFFAVRIVPAFRASDAAREVLRKYRVQVLLHVAMAFALILAGALTSRFVSLIVGLFWLAAGPLSAVSLVHKWALPHAVATPSIQPGPSLSRSGQLPGGWILQLGPFGILLATAAYLRLHWGEIPDRFPVHWGIDGTPNGWSLRTPADVYGPLLFGAALAAFISLIAYGISHAARSVSRLAAKPAKRDHAHRIAALMVGVEFFVAAAFSFTGLLPFTGNPGAAPLVIVALAILVSALLVRGWLRRAPDSPDEAADDGTSDSCWKLGLFYFNPGDSALFVEKRIGIGYTLNFARPAAWILLAVTLIVPFGVAALVIWKH